MSSQRHLSSLPRPDWSRIGGASSEAQYICFDMLCKREKDRATAPELLQNAWRGAKSTRCCSGFGLNCSYSLFDGFYMDNGGNEVQELRAGREQLGHPEAGPRPAAGRLRGLRIGAFHPP